MPLANGPLPIAPEDAAAFASLPPKAATTEAAPEPVALPQADDWAVWVAKDWAAAINAAAEPAVLPQASSSSGSGSGGGKPEIAAAEAKQEPVHRPEGNEMKIPQKPEKFFKNIMLPKLQAGGSVDMAGSLVEWVPRRLNIIRAARQEPNYETLRAEAKSVMASFDGLTMQGLAERRAEEGIRLMLKVTGPDGKVKQAGSYVFRVGGNGCCPRLAYIYLDMLRLMTMVCKHLKADLPQMKELHSQVKAHMDLMFEE